MQKLPKIPNREKSSAFWVITGKYRASNRSLPGRSRSVGTKAGSISNTCATNKKITSIEYCSRYSRNPKRIEYAP